MTIDWMKEAIGRVYDSAGWKERVRRMPDYQVVAIYKNFQRRDAFKKAETRRRRNERENKKYHQITIGEYLEQKGEN